MTMAQQYVELRSRCGFSRFHGVCRKLMHPADHAAVGRDHYDLRRLVPVHESAEWANPPHCVRQSAGHESIDQSAKSLNRALLPPAR